MIVKGSSYKYYETEYSNYRETRKLVNMHGIYIQAVQGGELRGFNFNNLLIQLTTALTLLAVATTLTDYCALYLLPDAPAYTKYKYEQTEDFSDLRDRERAAQKSGGGNVIEGENVWIEGASGQRLSDFNRGAMAEGFVTRPVR